MNLCLGSLIYEMGMLIVPTTKDGCEFTGINMYIVLNNVRYYRCEL